MRALLLILWVLVMALGFARAGQQDSVMPNSVQQTPTPNSRQQTPLPNAAPGGFVPAPVPVQPSISTGPTTFTVFSSTGAGVISVSSGPRVYFVPLD